MATSHDDIAPRHAPRGFRARLLAGERLSGLLVKHPSPALVETLARTRLDALVLDVEHVPFSRADIAACVAAAWHLGKPALIRLAAPTEEHLQQAVATGAAGAIVPHIGDAAQAARLVAFTRGAAADQTVLGNTRGAIGQGGTALSPAEIAAGFAFLAQLDDRAGLAAAATVAAVPEVDAVFLARSSLALALGAAATAPVVVEAMRVACRAAASAGRAIGMNLPGLVEREAWVSAGVTLFVAGTDAALLRQAADAAAAAIQA